MPRASIYFDKKGDCLIFPLWRDENGVSIKSIKYIQLEDVYEEKELGKKILKAIEISAINEQEDRTKNAGRIATKLKKAL